MLQITVTDLNDVYILCITPITCTRVWDHW